jgi:long-chain acyl-CoA synthetase
VAKTSIDSKTKSKGTTSTPAKRAAVAMNAAPVAIAPASKAKAVPTGKIWLKNYPEGVPAEITPLPFASLAELLIDSARKYANRPAYSCMGKTLTFAEVEQMSHALGGYLQSRGLQKGARVALMMPNVLQYPVAMMAALRAGYTIVNVNPLYTARELEHQLNDSGAEAIVILENFASTLQKVVANTKIKHIVVASLGDLLGVKGLLVNFVVRRVKKMVPAWSLPSSVSFIDALAAGRNAGLKAVATGPDDIAFLQYTGGTTGVSKGATLLNRNVLANIKQNAEWVNAVFAKEGKPDDLTYVCALPLYHIFALTVNALMGAEQGAHNILVTNPRDIPGFVKILKGLKFHILPGLNTLFIGLMNNEDFRKLDFSSLILTFGGGMAVQRAVADRWQSITGCAIHEGYGLSETSPVATANRFDKKEFTGTIGLPMPSTDIAIRDDDGNDLPLGEAGEICIRGPQVMAGYWNRPDETAKVMTADGYFRSGDIGIMDENGYVKIVDRKKDMILVSGFNVYPNEIEDVLAKLDGVLESAAIGVPDEKSGEAVKIFVVRKDPALQADRIVAFCKENLTGYKVPKHVEFRNELPKSNVGKILRKELR